MIRAAVSERPLAAIDRRKRAAAIAFRLAPAVEAAIAAELARIRPQSKQEQDILDACTALGEAVDRLEQARFGGVAEHGARISLERAATRVRNLLATHDKKHTENKP